MVAKVLSFLKHDLAIKFFLFVIVLDYTVFAYNYQDFFSEEGFWPYDFSIQKNLLVYYFDSFGSFLLSFPGLMIILVFINTIFSFVRGLNQKRIILLFVSIGVVQNRNVWILDGGDVFTIFFLYWLWLFKSLPSNKQTHLRYVYGVQLALIYICNGLLKNGVSWTETGKALEIIWSQPYISYTWINQLTQGIELKWLTFTARYLEMLLPILLFFRIYKFTAIFFILYHLVIFFTIRIDFFALVNISSWLILLYPPSLSAEQKSSRMRERSVLAIAIVFVLSGLIQMSSLIFVKRELPHNVNMFLAFTKQNQNWRMFTPDPRFTSYAYKFYCKSSDGSFQCPKAIKELEDVKKWGRRKKQFMIKLAEKKDGVKLAEAFHLYLCKKHPQLAEVKIEIQAHIKDLSEPSIIRVRDVELPIETSCQRLMTKR